MKISLDARTQARRGRGNQIKPSFQRAQRSLNHYDSKDGEFRNQRLNTLQCTSKNEMQWLSKVPPPAPEKPTTNVPQTHDHKTVNRRPRFPKNAATVNKRPLQQLLSFREAHRHRRQRQDW